MSQKKIDWDHLKPPIYVKKEHLELYVDLYKGIRSKEDPVTWRTLIITIKGLLEASDTEHRSLAGKKFYNAKKLVKVLVENTYLEPLTQEIYCSLGFSKYARFRDGHLDCLLYNGRHYSEPLLWTLAGSFKRRRKNVAVVNPVGHYSDGQSRILALGKLTRYVDRLVIVSSTQEMYGGNVSVLANVIRALRNKEFSMYVGEVDVVIPMFGGSRGHRLGQLEEIGYEVLEAVFNAKILALVAKDVQEQVNKDLEGVTPKIRFFSVDIHDKTYPAKVFEEEGFEFVSVSSAEAIANKSYSILRDKKLLNVPIRLVACDKGAVKRTEKLARALLSNPNNKLKSVDIVYIEKKREKAGIISEVKITNVYKWSSKGGEITKRRLKKVSQKPDYSQFILFYSDDMIDTGSTAIKDIDLLATKYPNAKLKIFAATHPVLSEGPEALDKIGADVYLLGNTLNPIGLYEHPKVEVIDLAPAITEGVSKKNERG